MTAATLSGHTRRAKGRRNHWSTAAKPPSRSSPRPTRTHAPAQLHDVRMPGHGAEQLHLSTQQGARGHRQAREVNGLHRYCASPEHRAVIARGAAHAHRLPARDGRPHFLYRVLHRGISAGLQ